MRNPQYVNHCGFNMIRYAQGAMSWTFRGVGGMNNYLENEPLVGAIPTLVVQERKVGVNVEKQFPGIRSDSLETRRTAFGKSAAAVREMKGHPFAQMELIDMTRRAKDGVLGGAGVRSGAPAAGGPGLQDAHDAAAARQQESTNKLLSQIAAGMGGRGGGGQTVAHHDFYEIGGGFGPRRA